MTASTAEMLMENSSNLATEMSLGPLVVRGVLMEGAEGNQIAVKKEVGVQQESWGV